MTHGQVFELRQDSSLGKLQVRTSDRPFLTLLKLERYLVCYSTALYKTDIRGHLNGHTDMLLKALNQAAKSYQGYTNGWEKLVSVLFHV